MVPNKQIYQTNTDAISIDHEDTKNWEPIDESSPTEKLIQEARISKGLKNGAAVHVKLHQIRTEYHLQ